MAHPEFQIRSMKGGDLRSAMRDLRAQLATLTEGLDATMVRLDNLKLQLGDRPSKDSIALYDIVYTLNTNLKLMTGDKYARIEDIQDEGFVRNHGGQDPSSPLSKLLNAIDSRFSTRKQFLRVTEYISTMHRGTCHLSIEERTTVFNYARLKALCDDVETQHLLEVLREIPGRNRDWPLAPANTS